MKIVILLNRRHARLRLAAKYALNRAYGAVTGSLAPFLPPEYDSFGSMGDEDPVVFGTGDAIPWDQLSTCNVLLWEWGWTSATTRSVLDVLNRCPLSTVVFPGPIDKFWQELDIDDLPAHLEALRQTMAVGAMLRDTIGFYQALAPWAHVFHMPVPLDLEFFSRFHIDDAERDPNLVLLTAPTRFTGRSSELPISTFAAFGALRRIRPGTRGLCFTYSAEEHRSADRVIRALGLEDAVLVQSFQRPMHRYLTTIRRCAAGLFLPRASIQGRTAMIAAAIGLPMVVSDEIETHRHLFEATAIRWTDAEQGARLCARILDDADFRSAISLQAAQRSEYYSVQNCRRRFSEAVAAIHPSAKADVLTA